MEKFLVVIFKFEDLSSSYYYTCSFSYIIRKTLIYSCPSIFSLGSTQELVILNTLNMDDINILVLFPAFYLLCVYNVHFHIQNLTPHSTFNVLYLVKLEFLCFFVSVDILCFR